MSNLNKSNDKDGAAGTVGAGAAVGAAIGSVVPGIGTAIGGAIGGGIGGVIAIINNSSKKKK